MKKIRTSLAALLLVCSFTVATFTPLLVTGCKNPSQQKQTVNTLWSVGAGVDASCKAYLDLVLKGQVTTNSVPKVMNYYGKFQVAFGLAVNAVAGNTNAVAPQSIFDAAAAFNGAVALAKKGEVIP